MPSRQPARRRRYIVKVYGSSNGLPFSFSVKIHPTLREGWGGDGFGTRHFSGEIQST